MTVLLTTFFCLFYHLAMQPYPIFELGLLSIALGTFSTLSMDLCNALGKTLKVHRGGSYALIGRWISGFRKGHFKYENILNESVLPNEVSVGLISHYGIGIILAFIYLISGQIFGLQVNNYSWAVIFGSLTNILPWLVMFPAFGFGIFALKGPPNNQLLRTSFLNHLGYGFGLGLGVNLLMMLNAHSSGTLF
jgi:hypothetical protein